MPRLPGLGEGSGGPTGGCQRGPARIAVTAGGCSAALSLRRGCASPGRGAMSRACALVTMLLDTHVFGDHLRDARRSQEAGGAAAPQGQWGGGHSLGRGSQRGAAACSRVGAGVPETPGGQGAGGPASRRLVSQVQPRERPRSTPATSRGRDSSTAATERLRRARPRSSSGLTATSRQGSWASPRPCDAVSLWSRGARGGPVGS